MKLLTGCLQAWLINNFIVIPSWWAGCGQVKSLNISCALLWSCVTFICYIIYSVCVGWVVDSCCPHFPHPRLTGSATHASFYLPSCHTVSQQFRLCIPKPLRLSLPLTPVQCVYWYAVWWTMCCCCCIQIFKKGWSLIWRSSSWICKSWVLMKVLWWMLKVSVRKHLWRCSETSFLERAVAESLRLIDACII